MTAVVNALESHAESHDEFAFLLSELMLVLRRIRYDGHEGVLSETEFSQHMQQVLSELADKLAETRSATSPMIAAYCDSVRQECNRLDNRNSGA